MIYWYRIIAFWVEYASVIEKRRLADAQNGTTAATQSFSFLPSLLQPTGRREYSWEFLEGEGGGVSYPVLQIHYEFAYYSSFLVELQLKLQIRSYSVHSLSSLENHSRFRTKMCKVYTPFQIENHTLWGNTYMYLLDSLYKGKKPFPPPPPLTSAREGAFNSWSFWIHMDPCLFSFFNHLKLTAELSSKMSKDRSLHGYLIY